MHPHGFVASVEVGVVPLFLLSLSLSLSLFSQSLLFLQGLEVLLSPAPALSSPTERLPQGELGGLATAADGLRGKRQTRPEKCGVPIEGRGHGCRICRNNIPGRAPDVDAHDEQPM